MRKQCEFYYRGDNEPIALSEVEHEIADAGFTLEGQLTTTSTEKAEDVPDDWFDDYDFVFTGIISADVDEETFNTMFRELDGDIVGNT